MFSSPYESSLGCETKGSSEGGNELEQVEARNAEWAMGMNVLVSERSAGVTPCLAR
jgi:hypothetical protein